MKQSILGTDAQKVAQKIKIRTTIIILLVVFTIAQNVLCVVLRNDENHNLMLTLNIAIDIVVGCFVIFYSGVYLRPLKKVYNLAMSPTQTVEGVISDISSNTQWNQGYECLLATIADRVFFVVDNGNINLEAGQTVKLSVTMNIVVEAELYEKQDN